MFKLNDNKVLFFYLINLGKLISQLDPITFNNDMGNKTCIQNERLRCTDQINTLNIWMWYKSHTEQMWPWKYIRLLVHQHFKSHHLFIREQGDLHKASHLTVKWVFDTKLVEVSTSQAFWIAQKRGILATCIRLQHTIKINIYNYISLISLCNK